jgi:hypothetical protein
MKKIIFKILLSFLILLILIVSFFIIGKPDIKFIDKNNVTIFENNK